MGYARPKVSEYKVKQFINPTILQNGNLQFDGNCYIDVNWNNKEILYPASTNFTKLTMYDLEKLGIQNDSITGKKIPLDEKKWISETYLLFGRCFSYVIPKMQKEHGVSII